MVESKITMAAEMMQSLSAENRWCVTGTPVQKDLKGMSLLDTLLLLLSLSLCIMWRNTMDGVEKEVGFTLRVLFCLFSKPQLLL